MARTWDAEAVRRLREQLGVTQAELADRIGTRQQTVSEWETGASTPRRMSQRLLRLVAEEAGVYDARDVDADERETTAEGGASGGGRAEDAR
ncbi:MAG: helix-turn-helix domain-containing protein [Dehalococcoidia bacterium]|nr:helix-turn-helix domain-containing protein [Dehalococcoidia bacterium]